MKDDHIACSVGTEKRTQWRRRERKNRSDKNDSVM